MTSTSRVRSASRLREITLMVLFKNFNLVGFRMVANHTNVFRSSPPRSRRCHERVSSVHVLGAALEVPTDNEQRLSRNISSDSVGTRWTRMTLFELSMKDTQSIFVVHLLHIVTALARHPIPRVSPRCSRPPAPRYQQCSSFAH